LEDPWKISGRGEEVQEAKPGRPRPEVQGLFFLGFIYLDFVFSEFSFSFSEINCRKLLDLFVFAGGRGPGGRIGRFMDLPFKGGDYYCRGAGAPGLTIDQMDLCFVRSHGILESPSIVGHFRIFC
jgi:hypothetical protein